MRKLVPFLILFFVYTGVHAQVANYTFEQSVGSYTPITGGTVVAFGSGSTGVPSLDDVIWNLPGGTIPFTFNFDGIGHTGLNISSNGFITFGATAPLSTTYTPLSATTTYDGAISPFGRDLQGGWVTTADRTLDSPTLTNVANMGPMQVGDFISGTGIPAGATITAITGSEITMSANATSTGTLTPIQGVGPWAEVRYETLGSAPNRVFVIQYSNFKRFGTVLTTVQHMSLNFQIRLYETSNMVEVVYNNCSPGLTTFTTTNQVGLRGPTNVFATNVNNRVSIKGSNDNWLNSAQGSANTSGMLFNNTAPANVIPNGLTYRWNSNVPGANVTILYTLGALPIGLGANHVVSAVVRNNSGGTLTNLNVTLDITGANTFNNIKVIASLDPGASTIVNFDPFTPTNLGSNNVTVSVPSSDGPTDLGGINSRYHSELIKAESNSISQTIDLPIYSLTQPVKTKGTTGLENFRINPESEPEFTDALDYSVTQTITQNQYSTALGPYPTGGVGFTGGTGDFVAKFNANVAGVLNQVDVNFVTGGQPFHIGVWDATGAGGSPGNLLQQTGQLTSAPGLYTVIIDPPVSISPGGFFVGVRQVGTVNVSFAFQTENPIRGGSFYFASPTGSTTWNDFAPANLFRFMIAPKFALNNDVAVTNIGQSGSQYYPEGTTALTMTGTVSNIGLNSATFNVIRRIYDGSNSLVYSNTQTVTNLGSNASQFVTYAPFNTYIPGQTYRIKDSTMLATDQNIANDTLTAFFTPNIARKTAVIWGDAVCRDTFVANFSTYFDPNDLDVLPLSSFSGSLGAWKSVVVLFADFQNWTPAFRNSMKDYLDNSSPADKKSLLVFGNDLGWHNDPIRNPAATPDDTLFYRQYLRGQYIADNWLTSIPTAAGKFKGMNAFGIVTLDSLNGPFPDCYKPVNGGITAFAPNNPGQAGDTAIASYFTNSDYNMFYAGNRYQDYKHLPVVDAPSLIFETIFDWIIDNGGVLPVDLISFNANVDMNNVSLSWSTAWEENNERFDVMRRVHNEESSAWTKVGSVSGSGTTYQPKSYSFVDKNLSTGKYEYKLVQYDFSGNSTADFDLNQIVEVGLPIRFNLAQNYPNPFNPVTKIGYDIPVESFVKLAIYDLSGREVAVLVNNQVTPGYYTVDFNAGSIASGVYFYRLTSANATITKKMMVLK